MKLVKNSAKITVNKLEDGKITFGAVMAHVNKTNDNGFYLNGDVVKFEREKYPFVYHHNLDSVADYLGYVECSYNEITGTYEAKITVSSTKPEIIEAIELGVYDSVSISYYVDAYEWGDNYELVVNEATMCELSLVSVGADPDAKLFTNGLSDEFQTEREKHMQQVKEPKENKKELMEFKKKYE